MSGFFNCRNFSTIEEVQKTKPLVEELFSIKEKYMGTKFADSNLDDSIEVIYAEDDGYDTDLHSCTIVDDERNWIKFYVDVNPNTDEIVYIDVECVDIGLASDDTIYDCIDLTC